MPIWMRFAFNLELRVPEIGNYVIVLSGCGITILMQSSSVTTSTLSLLVAVGPLRLVKVFPFTDGANIRTTVSGFRHDSCAVSPLLHIGRSAHLVPTAICLGRRTFDVESLGKHRSRHRRVPHTVCHWCLESSPGGRCPAKLCGRRWSFYNANLVATLLNPLVQSWKDLHRTQRDRACIWPR